MTAEPHGQALTISGLEKHFGPVAAVAGIDLDVRAGELITLLGASGSGKTTVLRLVAGFEEADAGHILLGDRDISTLAPAARGIGMVFQHYALFPHMTVADNIAYPLKRRKQGRAEIEARVAEVLELVRLADHGGRYPRQLSGGQQQRVALARAIAFHPSLLLMDEPLGALDKALRAEMVEEIRRVHRESGTTVIYVTHDQEEALTLSDRIGIVRDGRLLQVDTPQELFERPSTSYVATFFGECALVPVDVAGERGDGMWRVVALGREVEVRGQPASNGAPSRVAVRPGRFRREPRDGDVVLRSAITDVLYLGETVRAVCESEPLGRFVARFDAHDARGLRPGDELELGADLRGAPLLPE
jgi:putative spermidine/putrescine transport system ATP-binding protein